MMTISNRNQKIDFYFLFFSCIISFKKFNTSCTLYPIYMWQKTSKVLRFFINLESSLIFLSSKFPHILEFECFLNVANSLYLLYFFPINFFLLHESY
jgi:hypothetical protein